MVRSGISSRVRKVEGATVKHAHQFIIGRWQNLYEVRRNIGLWLLGVGVLVFAMAIHFLLLRSGYTEVAQVRGGTYAEAVAGRISTLNPLYATTAAEVSASKLLFSSLFRYDSTGSLSGDLATGYRLDETGKIYTVTMRNTAYWHDKKPVTVDDVVFTVGLLKHPSLGSVQADSWKDIEVKKINDTTLQFILPAAYAPFPNALTFAVLPKHILAKTPSNMLRESVFSNTPVGSGPFSFHLMQRVKGQAHTVVHAVRHDMYHHGAPKLERFQLHAYEQIDSLAEALKKQAVNAASGVPAQAAAELKKDTHFTMYATPLNAGVYAIFNTATPQLKELQVRHALQAGTDLPGLFTKLAYKPQMMPLPILPSQVRGLDDILPPAYDAARANALLDGAGWQRGENGIRQKESQPLLLRVAFIKDSEYEKVANSLKQQWKRLGIDVQLRPVDTSDPTQNLASTVLQPRDYDVLIHELAIGADPDVYAYWHSSQAVARGLNLSNYTDGISDDALASGRSRAAKELRDAKYRTFVNQWLKQAPALGLYRSSSFYIVRKGANAIDANMQFVTAADRYANVQYWTARTDTVYKTP